MERDCVSSGVAGRRLGFICALSVLLPLATAGARIQPVDTVTARAGEAVALPCPGLSDSSAPGGFIVNHLSWSCSRGRKYCIAADLQGELAVYAARAVHVRGDRARVRVDERSWSLQLQPVTAADSALYSCSFNGQSAGGPGRTVRLLVRDVPGAPGRPMVVHHSSRYVDLSWAPSLQTNNSPVKHYLIQARRGDGAAWPAMEAAHQTSSNASRTRLAGLQPFTVYTFRVTAVNALGNSAASDASYPVSTLRESPGAAPAPDGWRNVSSSAVEVRWTPPPNSTLYGEFVAFVVSWRRSQPPGPLMQHQVHELGATSYTITGLEAYTEYKVMLAVRNPEDIGPSSSLVVHTAEGVPSAPESLRLSDVNDRNVTLSWRAPRRARGRLTGYQLSWAAGRRPALRRRLPGADTQQHVLTGLEPATIYTLWLSAATAAGLGARSGSVRVKTDVSGPGPPDVTNVTCPSDQQLRLRWRRPLTVYGAVKLYYVLYRPEAEWSYVERVVPADNDQMQYSILLPNLTSGQIYEIRIQGATPSELVSDRWYKGERSMPRKVRLERGCEEIEPLQTWQHRPAPAGGALAGAELLAGFSAGLLLLVAAVAAVAICRRRRCCAGAVGATGRAKPAAGGASGGWCPAGQHCLPTHLFTQHVQQLHSQLGQPLQREWRQLQPSPTAGVPDVADGVKTSDGGDDDAGGAAPQLKSTDASTGAAGGPVPVPVPIGGRLQRGRRSVPAVYAVDGYRRRAGWLVTAQLDSQAAVEPLWQLVWQQRVADIVLIGPQPSCALRFWPEPGAMRLCGRLHIEAQTEHSLAFSVVHKIAITKHKERRRRWRTVTVHQYTHWPDYGVPDNPLPLLHFVSSTGGGGGAEPRRRTLVISPRPCLYVCLSALLSQLSQHNQLAVFSCCHHMSGQCPLMTPSLAEYAALYACLLERVAAGQTAIGRRDLWAFSADLRAADAAGCASPVLQRQYMSAVAMEPEQYSVISAGQPYNEAKNRSLAFVPVEASRVCLMPKPSVEGSDYINASWLPGYRHAREYVITQHPLPNTMLDFWQLVWENRISTVVCLTPPAELGVFWPGACSELDCDTVVVRSVDDASPPAGAQGLDAAVSLLLESTEGESDLSVRLVLLPGWPQSGATAAAAAAAVQRIGEMSAGRRAPVAVVDRFGGTEAASFCLLSTVLHQLLQEDRLDLYLYAKLYHQRRPGIWRTMEEYVAVHRLLDGWLSTDGQLQQQQQKPLRIETRLSGVDGVIV